MLLSQAGPWFDRYVELIVLLMLVLFIWTLDLLGFGHEMKRIDDRSSSVFIWLYLVAFLIVVALIFLNVVSMGGLYLLAIIAILSVTVLVCLKLMRLRGR